MVFRPDDCNATWIPEPDFSMVKPRGDHMSLLVSVVCANRQSCQGRRGGGRGGRRGGGEEGPAEDKPGIKTSRRTYRRDEPRTPKNSPTTSPVSQNSPAGAGGSDFGRFLHSFDSDCQSHAQLVFSLAITILLNFSAAV